jgi:hypothetical protein
MKAIRARLSFANIMSCLAVFVALGGSSYAAVKVKRNSVGSAQIKNNSIKSTDVKNKSLLAKDFRSGQLLPGPQGATGPRGLQGLRGVTGTSGLAKVTVVRQDASLDDGETVSKVVPCATGSRAIGGGAGAPSTSGGTLRQSYPVTPTPGHSGDPTPNGSAATGWTSIFPNDTGSNNLPVLYYAVCAAP